MQPGDLVKVCEHCKNGGALAIVLETFPTKLAKIQYAKPSKEGQMTAKALLMNLEVISEA